MQIRIDKQFAPEVRETQVIDLEDEKITVTLINDELEMEFMEFLDTSMMMAERMQQLVDLGVI